MRTEGKDCINPPPLKTRKKTLSKVPASFVIYVLCFSAYLLFFASKPPCLSSCLCCIKCLYCLLTFKAAHFLVGLRCRIAKVCLNGFTLLFLLKVVLYEKLYPAKKCATLSVSAFWLKSVCFALFGLP